MSNRGRASSLTAAIGTGADEEKWWEASANVEELGAWRALVTADGVDYYLNIETNETQWEKPLELMTDEEMNEQGEWLWVPDEENVYVPAKLDSGKGEKLRVTTLDGEVKVVKKQQTMGMKRSFLQRTTDDLTLLDDLAAPLILHNLRKRFEKGDIYTNIGNILISINPYQRLPLYTDDVIRQ
jgi:myosin protein heavy chain